MTNSECLKKLYFWKHLSENNDIVVKLQHYIVRLMYKSVWILLRNKLTLQQRYDISFACVTRCFHEMLVLLNFRVMYETLSCVSVIDSNKILLFVIADWEQIWIMSTTSPSLTEETTLDPGSVMQGGEIEILIFLPKVFYNIAWKLYRKS